MKISQILLVAIAVAIIAMTSATAQGEEAGEACENPDISVANEYQPNEAGSSELLRGALRESGGGSARQSENSFFEKQTGNPTTSLLSDSYNSHDT